MHFLLNSCIYKFKWRKSSRSEEFKLRSSWSQLTWIAFWRQNNNSKQGRRVSFNLNQNLKVKQKTQKTRATSVPFHSNEDQRQKEWEHKINLLFIHIPLAFISTSLKFFKLNTNHLILFCVMFSILKFGELKLLLYSDKYYYLSN